MGYRLPDQTEFVCTIILRLGKTVKPLFLFPRDTGIGSVTDIGRSDVSSPIRSIKMYSYAQCTMQERSVYPAWPIWSWDLAPSTLSTYPPPHLPGVMGTQFTSSLQEGLTWTVEWRFVSSPTQILRSRIMYVDIIFIPFRKLSLECLSNDYLPSTDCCYIFLGLLTTRRNKWISFVRSSHFPGLCCKQAVIGRGWDRQV